MKMEESKHSGNPVPTDAQTVTIDGIKYSLEDGKATVLKQDEDLSGDIVIPEDIVYKDQVFKVRNVAEEAFAHTEISSIKLPDSIKALGEECFCECSNLISIDMPSGITSLGDLCFHGCSSLTSIKLPNSITSLGDYCFDFCFNITSIDLPDSITSLGDYCFFNCFSLSKVTCRWTDLEKVKTGRAVFSDINSRSVLLVPECKTSIYERTASWSDFGYIIEQDDEKAFDVEFATIDGVKYFLAVGEASIIKQDESLSGDIVVPETVTCKGKCYMTRSVVASAFARTRITSIVLPDSVTTLGERCFMGCSSLTSVKLPNDITTLGDYCFDNCTSLTSIDLPNTITSLGDRCFAMCYELTSIDMSATSITSLGDSCFACCKFTSVDLPGGITSLGASCFSQCSNLASINLPANLTSLGNYCFYYCSSLTSIKLPNSIKALRDECFRGCFALSKVVCEWENLDNVAVGHHVFKSINADCTLYVPKGTESLYAWKEPWRNFLYITVS